MTLVSGLTAWVSQGPFQAILESLQPGQEWLFPGLSSGHLSTKTVFLCFRRLNFDPPI